MIEHLVGALVRDNLGVGDFHAQRDALLLRVALDLAKNGCGIVGAFLRRHAPAFTRNRDQVGTTDLGAHVDALVEFLFEATMQFLSDQAVAKAGSCARHHCGSQPMSLQDRNLLGAREIHTFESDSREDLAFLLDR